MRQMLVRLFAVSVLLLALTPVAQAETQTLEQALALAYQHNPTLEAARARLRATDEKVAVARSGWRPSIDAVGGAGMARQNFQNWTQGTQNLSPRDVGVVITQPVFRGFRTVAGEDSAQAQVNAQRSALREAEQQLLLEAAKTYLDVVQGQCVVALTRSNEEVLTQQLDSTRERFKVGEVTKTDISQAEARLSVVTATYLQAQGELDNARASYARLMGDMPGTLAPPDLALDMPHSLDDAMALAQKGSPIIQATAFNLDAAKADVTATQGSLLPEVNLVGSASRGWDVNPVMQGRQDSATLMARVTVPLYRAGADYAKTRAAHQTAMQRKQELTDAQARTRESVIRAWQNLMTSRASITAHKASVKATEMALAGVREEAKVGTRTTLDILNAEQERLNAQVNLVKVQHDEALAALQLRAATGRLTAQDLKLPVTSYDPTENYGNVSGKWIGMGSAE